MTLITLAIAVSFDSATVGLIYGIRGIRLSIIPLCIIMLQSAIVVTIAMTAGSFLKKFLSPHSTEVLGSVVLILLGAWILSSLLLNSKHKQFRSSTQKSPPSPASLLRTPERADIDDSGTISIGEAFFLGLALALDAFGAGVAAAFLAYSVFMMPFVVACFTGIFLYIGLSIGRLFSHLDIVQRFVILPPILLISVGLFHLIAG